MEDRLWMQCSALMKQLQCCARELRTRKQGENNRISCPHLLQIMQRFRKAINEQLLLKPTSDFSALLQMMASVRVIVSHCKSQWKWSCLSVTELMQTDDQSTQQELAFIQSLSLSTTQCEKLAGVVQELRKMEHDRSFHAQMLLAQLAMLDFCEYQDDNFAFGTTPITTWYRILHSTIVRNALIKCQHEESFTVFGSSTGSLVLFTALLESISCRGVEIVPYFHGIACKLQQTYGISNCLFENRDMLDVAVDRTRVLVLTSQCWDHSLIQRLVKKLEQELQPGTIVIDYQSTTVGSSYAFELVEQLEDCPVSWNHRQTMYVFQKRIL